MNPKNADHSEECLAASIRHELTRIGYALQWPDHCQACGGWGGSFYHYDPSPAGISLGSGYMTDCDPCQVCSENGRCPRCNAESLNDENEYASCDQCGWNMEESVGMDEPFECVCWDWNEPDWDHVDRDWSGPVDEVVQAILDAGDHN